MIQSPPFITKASDDKLVMLVCPPQAGSVAGDAAAAARFRAALAAKEEVEHRLETELAAARAQAASYEHRSVLLRMNFMLDLASSEKIRASFKSVIVHLLSLSRSLVSEICKRMFH